MDQKKKDRILRMGRRLAKLAGIAFGSIRFNFKNGRCVNVNVEECTKASG
jgi:hypothetical protein